MLKEHDPDELRRRLARYFDTIPHLAVVSVAKSIVWGESKFVVHLDLDLDVAKHDEITAAVDEAFRLLRRVARLLGVRALADGSDGGPMPFERVIYVRDQHHACWGRWLADESYWQKTREDRVARLLRGRRLLNGTPREPARGMTTSPRTITIVEALRDRAGWTRTYLADRANVADEVIARHEDSGGPLSEPLLRRLAAAFVVPVEALRGNAPIPGARPRLLDDGDPNVMRLLRAVDPALHTVSDFDAARAAYYAVLAAHARSLPPGEVVVLRLLEAARLLRVEGKQAAPVLVLARSWQLDVGGE